MSYPLTQHEKVLALNPIACWPLWSPAGAATAYDISGNGYDSTAMVISSAGNDGVGDQSTSFEFDGTNDYVNIYSAGLAGAFLGTEVTVGMWFQVSGAGVWTDGTIRYLLRLYADASNEISFARVAANNTLQALYRAGGVNKARYPISTSTEWICIVMTASLAADEMRTYLNGVQYTTTLTGLGTWNGTLDSSFCVVGASTLVPANVWDGFITHTFIINRALTPDQVYNISVPYP